MLIDCVVSLELSELYKLVLLIEFDRTCVVVDDVKPDCYAWCELPLHQIYRVVEHLSTKAHLPTLINHTDCHDIASRPLAQDQVATWEKLAGSLEPWLVVPARSVYVGHHSFIPLALRLNFWENDADQDKLLCILTLIVYWDFVEAADRNDSVTLHAVIEFLRVIDWEPFGVE